MSGDQKHVLDGHGRFRDDGKSKSVGWPIDGLVDELEREGGRCS